jgi:NAD(P)-dependent dehydrogenase (short-subunit alcohol dehydrogenase family)
MKQFKGKVAVITGGASGIGLALARRAAAEGMKLVLADIEEGPLAAAAAELKGAGAKVLTVKTDVSRAEAVENLAAQTLQAFGGAHLLFNNAGVGGVRVKTWQASAKDWEWVLGVNVWGVIHGVRVFLPIMLRQDAESHVVNTASVAGLLSVPNMGIYCVSKHAVVTLTECLYHDVAQRSSRVGVSLLCPAYVPTGIIDSERNRPALLRNAQRVKTPEELAREEVMRKAVQSGKISAEQVAEMVFDAVQSKRFYILTHPKIKGAIQMRMEDILQDRSPTDTSKPVR